ncbi:MAG: hypothetical protein A2X42_12645 [Candidatus Margulisbacteria bacterium GWF2_38_17]|nr:MAG: hypothetical protein A2X43_11360 [Candidatus Margulisbacteria bacterium GWD2_39_127]OGI05463.1 MAG: hypothetical protein A2X42_12645 [Candidatus Margulisbacteria bacterium GWF2_38_17]OGI06832.1 MAG: hypothetical protein A2X41_12580 [Candidatus Margulisbacteria bacterium GWE2_39_32]
MINSIQFPFIHDLLVLIKCASQLKDFSDFLRDASFLMDIYVTTKELTNIFVRYLVDCLDISVHYNGDHCFEVIASLLSSFPSSNVRAVIKVPVPDINEQIKIAQCAVVLNKELEQLNTKRAVIKTQKKGLMQVLLTGKIRVKL